MKVLFIGGTGLISEAVSRLVVKKGMNLYLLNRGNRNELVPGGVEIITGDIRDKKNVSEILKNYQFDVVVDWIAFTEDHIKVDLRLFKDKIEQYIFISSASVYQKPPTQYLITESTPLANPYWQYSQNKIACEELLIDEYRKNGFPITIVRPSHTYGKTGIPSSLNSSSHPWSLIDRILNGKEIIVHGDGTSLWTMTHNTDFAKGFVGLLGNMQSIGHAFHITSDEVLSWNQIYRAIGKAVGVSPKIVHISSDFIINFLPEKSGSLLGDKARSCVFDNSKIKKFVPEYKATVPFQSGVKQSIEWFNEHPKKCKTDKKWNKIIDKIIDRYKNALNY